MQICDSKRNRANMKYCTSNFSLYFVLVVVGLFSLSEIINDASLFSTFPHFLRLSYSVGVGDGDFPPVPPVPCDHHVENNLPKIPIVMIIGFQKSVTSAARWLAKKYNGCHSRSGEPDYWSKRRFVLNEYPTCNEVFSNFLEPEFSHCYEKNNTNFLLAKAPCP